MSEPFRRSSSRPPLSRSGHQVPLIPITALRTLPCRRCSRACIAWRPGDVGAARSQVVSSSVTTYRFDTARGVLTDVATSPASAAGLDALLGARLFPVRRLVEPNLVELAVHGFNVAHDGRVWGTVGEIELKLAGDETVRVVFGASIEHERAAIVEGRDDDAVWIYAVDEAIVRRVLGLS